MGDTFPIGAVTAFAGTTLPAPSSDTWLLCDGAPLSTTDPKYQALFASIGYTYGGSERSGKFNLPDYRGRFIRGVDGGAGNDAGAATRLAHADEHPDQHGKMAEPVGDGVGTIQSGATARPATSFTALFPHLPQDAKHTAATIFNPPHAAAWKDGSRTIDTNTGGGDSETRPINLYVDYYIKFAAGN